MSQLAHPDNSDLSDELRLWNYLKRESGNEIKHTVQVGQWAHDCLPLNQQQASEIVKRWQNNGLVRAYQNGKRASLTVQGVNTHTP